MNFFLIILLTLLGSVSSDAIVNGSSGTMTNHPLSVFGLNASGRCTGTKVGANLYLTARHCLLSSRFELNDEAPLVLLGNYMEQRVVIRQKIKGSSNNFKVIADIKEIFLRSNSEVLPYEKGSIYLENNSKRIANDVAFFTLHDNDSDKLLDELPISEFDFSEVEEGNDILIAGYGKTECNNHSYMSLPYIIKVAKQTVEKTQYGIFSSTGSKTKPYIAGGDSGAAVFRTSTDKVERIVGIVSTSHSGRYIPILESYKGRCFPQGGYSNLTEQESFIRDVLEKRIVPAVRFDRDV